MTLELFVIDPGAGVDLMSSSVSLLFEQPNKRSHIHIDRAGSNSIMAPPVSAATELKKRKRGLSVDDLRRFFAQNHPITKLPGTS